MQQRKLYDIVKRGLDFLCALILLAVLLIPFAVIAIAVKCDSKGTVFFKQKRVGIHKTYFYILKFRSMYSDTDPNAPTHLLGNATSHITKVGAFLRRTSLDELPQLLNILTGQMSFVGPRPALWNQDDLVAERDRYFANDVKPGLTGLAQVSGRDELPIAVKAKLDGEYVEKRSLGFDLRILFRTVLCVLKHEGVVEGGTGAMEVRQNDSEVQTR